METTIKKEIKASIKEPVAGSSLADRSTKRLLQRLSRIDVLLIDEFGYVNAPSRVQPQPKEYESSPRVILHRDIGYFSENRKGMDYPRFRAEGWPLGSGVAEGAVKQFGMRLKGSEKFWNGFGCGLGAEEMLALCALHRSEDGKLARVLAQASIAQRASDGKPMTRDASTRGTYVTASGQSRPR